MLLLDKFYDFSINDLFKKLSQDYVCFPIWYKYCFSIRWMVLRINRLMFGLLSDRFMRKSKNQSIYVIWLSNKIFDEKTEYQSVEGLLSWFGVLGSWKRVVMVPVFRLFYRLHYTMGMMEKIITSIICKLEVQTATSG